MPSVLDRVSYHAVYDESVLAALDFARSNGFAGVQIAVQSPRLSFENVSEAECDEIARFARTHGLHIALHGPDVSASLFTAERSLHDGIFEYFTEMFAFAERVAARVITLHVGEMPRYAPAPRPAMRMPEPYTPQ